MLKFAPSPFLGEGEFQIVFHYLKDGRGPISKIDKLLETLHKQ